MRPAHSDSVCEHGDSRAGGARVIPTFSRRGRDQPAKRAGGRQAAEAGHHRAQRVQIKGHAQAHRAAGQVLLVQAAADAESCACSLRTVTEIMMNAASSTGLRRVKWPAKEQQWAAQHAVHTLSSGASGAADAAASEKVGIKPERWLEASRPRQTSVFSTAEQSSVAKEEWFRSRPSIPQCVRSWRGRGGKLSLKEAPP